MSSLTSTTEVRAAVARTPGAPLQIESLRLRELGPHEVLVKNAASGICHTDLSASQGSLGLPFPMVPGHEGVGVVLECGSEVTMVSPGDHVIVALMPECGECPPCRSGTTNACATSAALMADPVFLDSHGEPVRSLAFGATFASHTVAPQTALVPIPADVPLDVAALVGCGVSTGVGAVRNTAKVHEGSSVVVFGLGSIGLNVIQAAKLAGAGSITALDTKEHRRELAQRLGATEVLDPASLTEEVLGRIGGPSGVDYVFECVGSVSVLRQAIALSNPFWGVCVAVGVPPFSENYEIPASTFLLGRTLRGTCIGDVKPRSQLPGIVEDYRQGRLDLESLVTARIGLEQVNDGFDQVRAGQGVRTVVVHD